MKMAFLSVAAMMGCSTVALASEQSQASGFVEGSTLSVKARNVYFNRDQRARGAEQSYGEEWAQGFIGTFQSGFTAGTVGVGFDLLGMAGFRLDTGDGRTGGGTRLLEQNSDGAKPSYGSMGGAVKLRVSNTTLKFGDQIVNTPVLGMSDSRLLPETVQGLLVTSNEIARLKLQAGHFTALKLRNDSAHDSGGLTGIDLVGAVYDFSPEVQASVYHSDVDDYWRKNYGGLVWTVPLSGTQAVKFDANVYGTRSQGQELGGELDNRIWSLAASYKTGAHTFMLARQQVHGTGDFRYGVEGNSAIYVANSSQYSDFIYEGEKSWQARYAFDAAPYGIPGLNFMVRYIRGTDFTTATGRDGKAWERDIELRYVVQSGFAKDLGWRVRNAVYRSSDRGGDINEIVVTTEYPLSIF